MPKYQEGDLVRHNLDPDLELEVVRADTDWLGEQVLVVREPGYSYTVKVQASEVTKEDRT